jgi:hypothetical protein
MELMSSFATAFIFAAGFFTVMFAIWSWELKHQPRTH